MNHEQEEQNLVRWLVRHRNLININQIEKEAQVGRVISQVLANVPKRHLRSHLDKIIPVVSKLGYKHL